MAAFHPPPLAVAASARRYAEALSKTPPVRPCASAARFSSIVQRMESRHYA